MSLSWLIFAAGPRETSRRQPVSTAARAAPRAGHSSRFLPESRRACHLQSGGSATSGFTQGANDGCFARPRSHGRSPVKSLGPRARRVVIKSRIVKLDRGGVNSMRPHLSTSRAKSPHSRASAVRNVDSQPTPGHRFVGHITKGTASPPNRSARTQTNAEQSHRCHGANR